MNTEYSVNKIKHLEKIKIFELFLLFSLFPDWFVHHPPLLDVEALELPDGPEAPDKPDGPDDDPDEAHGVVALGDRDALPACSLALLLEESPVAGVVCLVPGGTHDGLVVTEDHRAELQVCPLPALPARLPA